MGQWWQSSRETLMKSLQLCVFPTHLPCGDRLGFEASCASLFNHRQFFSYSRLHLIWKSGTVLHNELKRAALFRAYLQGSAAKTPCSPLPLHWIQAQCSQCHVTGHFNDSCTTCSHLFSNSICDHACWAILIVIGRSYEGFIWFHSENSAEQL